MSRYLNLAFAGWLTPIYLLILAVIAVAVIYNIMQEEKPLAQIVGGMVLIPLLLRLFLIK